MLKRIAVLVSGGGTNLQAIIDAQKSGQITAGEVVAVVSSSRDAYALERARENGIDSFVVSRKECSDQKVFSAKLIGALQNIKPDLIVLAGFMCILDEDFIRNFEYKIINIHPSLIPSFCGDGYYGIKVHERALEYGVKISGATVHFVNEVTDGGAIILQKAVEICQDDTAEKLQKRIMEQAEWKLLPEAIELFCQDRLIVEGRKVRIKE